MDINKFVELLAQSPEFTKLVHDQRLKIEAETAVHGPVRELKRARLMEPELAEGEWLLQTDPAGDD